jgi:RNAse (barnase) inhibitor barstar
MSDAAGIVKSAERLLLADGDAAALARDVAAAAGGEVFLLDGAQARDKASFMTAAAQAMSFPDHFGRNWDAVADCVDELHWRDEPITIVVANADQLLADEPAELDAWLRVTRDAFAANPELPQSRLKVVLIGTPQAPAAAHAQRLGIPIQRI